MTALTDLAVAEARQGLRKRQFSAREMALAHIDAMAAARPLNAFIAETPERALAMAEASDRRLAKGEALPLDGMPLAIKDLFCTEGVQTTAGSRILGGFTPFYESTVTAKLWRAGAVMLGGCRVCVTVMVTVCETLSWPSAAVKTTGYVPA